MKSIFSNEIVWGLDCSLAPSWLYVTKSVITGITRSAGNISTKFELLVQSSVLEIEL